MRETLFELENDPLIRILFGILATLGILTALGTVLAKNLVHAALFLVAFFFLIACQFVMLEAEFMAAMQVLVYIGAVAIILMFGIMLTRNIQGDETTGGHWSRKIPAGIVALGMLVVLIAGIWNEKPLGNRPAWSAIMTRPEAKIPSPKGPSVDGRSLAISDMSRTIGNEMMQRFVISFEVAGLLLTAALVGAIALARSEEQEDASRSGATADVRGGTTQQPNPGMGVMINGSTHGHPAPLASAKLHPASETHPS